MSAVPKNHPFVSFHQELKNLISPLRSLGIDYLSYTRVYPNGDRIYLNTLPTIIEDYLAQKKYFKVSNEIDPLLQPSNKIVLWETLPNQEVFAEAKKLGVCHGIFVFNERKNLEYSESFGFATSKNDKSIINSYFNNISVLKRFAQEFQNDGSEFILKALENKINLPFNNDPNHLSSLNKFHPPTNLQQFTKRELDCIKFLLQGMSAKMIAKALMLSNRTVEHYLENLRNKLACKNKTELIIKLGKYFDMFE